MTQLFAFPLHLKAPNGYWDQLYREIRRQRPALVVHHAAWGRLLLTFGGGNVVHVHWPSQLYGSRFTALAWVRFIARAFILLIARIRGDRIIWTVHNLADHERIFPALDALAHWCLAGLSHTVIVHTPAGEAYVRARWGRSKDTRVIPHGNYIDFHGVRISQPDQRFMRELGIMDGDRVFLAIGSVRPYKGLERLIEIFNGLPATIRLVIAGSASEDAYVRSLRRTAYQGNVIIKPGLIPGEALPRYFSLGLCSLFAFTEILTSGSVILSLSYGVPAVVPAMGDMPYVIEEGVNGFLYSHAAQLKILIEKVARMEQAVLLGLQRGALESVAKVSYRNIAEETLQTYGV